MIDFKLPGRLTDQHFPCHRLLYTSFGMPESTRAALDIMAEQRGTTKRELLCELIEKEWQENFELQEVTND